jgi:limonene-1,2-epoxide hydrolase
MPVKARSERDNQFVRSHVAKTFEVSGGKINAWRDYFDMNQFTSRMG